MFFERRLPGCCCCCCCNWEENTLPGDSRSSIDCGMDVDGGSAKLCTMGDDGVVGEDNNCVNLSV